MIDDDLFSSMRRTQRLLEPLDLLRDRMGMDAPSTIKALHDAHRKMALASDFAREVGGLGHLEHLRGRTLDWSAAAQARDMIHATALRTAREHAQSASMRATLGWLDGPSTIAARGLLDDPSMSGVRDLAQRASQLSMPTALAAHRTSVETLYDRIGMLGRDGLLADRLALDAFTRTSAVSDAIAYSTRVDAGLIAATREFAMTTMPALGTLASHRAFLDAAGLKLHRWPRIRLLTTAEKRKRLKARLRQNAEPPQVRKAKSLVHRYELTMREIIDAAMAETYGEDWAEERLPLCDCKSLLGKRSKRGGDVLDHADYAHYRLIMSHPEHFSDIFHVAFDDPQELADLVHRAGRLRAASHHQHDFTPEDLLDLRLVWNTLEAGLLALTSDVAVDDWF